jgi:hypothetical protein
MSLDQYTGYIPIVGSLIASIIAVGTIIDRRLGKREKQQDELILKLREDLYEEKRLRTIHETQFNMFWEYYKQEVPKMLTHPHTPELDELHRIMEKRELTLDEKREYVRLVGEIIDRNFEIPYVQEKIGVYGAMRAQYRKDLDAPKKIQEINQYYEQEKKKLWEEYERKKNRKFKFWH